VDLLDMNVEPQPSVSSAGLAGAWGLLSDLLDDVPTNRAAQPPSAVDVMR
jgi:hypothetical protein